MKRVPFLVRFGGPINRRAFISCIDVAAATCPCASSAVSKTPPITSIRRLLVANRGEIACKIIAHAASRGIRTIAVYTAADCNAKHVRVADEAFRIASDSYVDVAAIVRLGVDAHADAVHPGYGFLAESAQFACATRNSGMLFVGPPAAAILTLADKLAAKRLAAECGVPTVEWRLLNDDHVTEDATFPLMLRPVRGGGGRGARVVASPETFPIALAEARAEAAALQPDSPAALFIEPFVSNGRHIEVQVLADAHGNIVCFPERECSVQRRMQKIIEESPAAGVDASLRAQLALYARRIAAAVGLRAVATVEFLVVGSGAKKRMLFVEANARLQVEHALTERICSVDLLEAMLRVTEGAALVDIDARFGEAAAASANGGVFCWRGHAIEARVIAEDPTTGAPVDGVVTGFAEPPAVVNCSVDSAVALFDAASPAFDPLLAKIVVWREEGREAARVAMLDALRSFWVAGLRTTNLSFLLDAFQQPLFRDAAYDCSFVSAVYPRGFCVPALTETERSVLCLAALFVHCNVLRSSPFDVASFVALQGTWYSVEQLAAECGVSSQPDLLFERFRRRGRSSAIDDVFSGMLLFFEGTAQTLTLFYRGTPYAVRIVNAFQHAMLMKVQQYVMNMRADDVKALQAHKRRCISAIPGKVSKIFVRVGDIVCQNQPILLLESMKMQNAVRSPINGKIERIFAVLNSFVPANTLLVEFAEELE